MMFSLDQKQSAKFNKWVEDQMQHVVELQKGTEAEKFHVKTSEGITYPYFGATGGCFTYSFTPTSLGTVTRAIFCEGTPYEATIDLTDYDEW